MAHPLLRRLLLLLLVAALVRPVAAQEDPTRLLRQPTVSANHIVFAHAGELWRVGHDGGDAERLTSFSGVASHPRLSPDGERVAFSGEYNGQTDVYVVPVDGGTPERLTWHPSTDEVQGWAPDGSHVLFTSGRDSAPASYNRFWTVSPDGGSKPSALQIPRADVGRYGPEGERMVYQPIARWQEHWRGYRGGQTHPLWIIDLDNYRTTEIPFEGGIDTRPFWVGDTIYFISDRTDMVRNVHAYEVGGDSVRALTNHTEFDVKTMGAADGTLVYEQAGRLHRIDLASGEATPLDITVQGDFPWTQTQWKEVGDDVMNANLSPTGVRAVFGARGEIFTVPAEEGDWRNLSETPAQADRFPAWSPEGDQVAWFSDRSGEYQLMIGPQDGQEEPRAIDLPPSFYYRPQWSPDGSHLLFTDADRNLWLLELESEELTKVDYDLYAHPQRSLNPEWSPDGDWIAYSKRMHNQFRTLYAYSLERDTSLALTDGMADAVHPTWDKSGDYLYFMASTDYGLNTGWLDMSSYERDVERGLYLAVLDADTPSPLLPESDEEPVDGDDENGDETEEDDDGDVQIDLDGLEQRILSLDVPVETYDQLYAATQGTIFFGETGGDQPGLQIHRYQLDEDEATPYLNGVTQFAVSHDGQKALYQARGQWGIVETAGSPSVGDGSIDVSGLEMKVDPTAEWEQLFEEAWRLYRDYLYADNHHGLDWDTIRALYAPWLDDVRHRSDLNYLIANMIGELSLGHTYVGGGDMPEIEGPGTGLLGADLEAEQGRYRFARIFDGESWNPDLRAPLRAPGLDVSEGDYLIAVDGTDLTADMNPYRLFEGQVDRQVTLLVNDAPTREGAREVTVVPVGSEAGLRTQAWVEDNRRRVAEASDGQLGYVWVPNTAQAGYENFNRYYFSQQDRDGIIIDERFNGGGSAADYMIDVMARDLHGFFNNPIGDRDPFTTPGAGVWGPKVMVTNEAAGSGGDLLPYMFKREDLGPTVGRTTWGGLVGIWDTPPLIDGGFLTVPRGGFYDRDGEWAVENEGVAPDVRIIQRPREVINGADPQLDRAVQEALQRLPEDNPILPEPAPPTPAPRGQQ